MNRTEIEQQLTERAQRDPSFRQRLLRDPRGTLAGEFSITIPSSIRLQVLEEDANNLMLVLPSASGELSDVELESVAGGKSDPLIVDVHNKL